MRLSVAKGDLLSAYVYRNQSTKPFRISKPRTEKYHKCMEIKSNNRRTGIPK